MLKQLILAFQFLTIIPIRNSMSVNEADVAKSSAFFVVVGLVQGILLVATDYISGMVFHPDLSIGMVILVLVLSNGGFHLDGLADTFDAIAVKSESHHPHFDKGGQGGIIIDRQKRLSIMKDSTVGPIGVSAIIFSLGIKYLALKNLSHFSTFTYYSSLLLMPILSKWAMVVSMFYGKASREDGLGRIFINRIGLKEIAISTIMLSILLILLQAFFSRYISDMQYAFYIILLFTIYLSCRWLISLFNKRFGGLNGDTLGAISEITEIIFLLMVIIWSRLYI